MFHDRIMIKNKQKVLQKNSKKVKLYTNDGEIVFNSINECARKLRVSNTFIRYRIKEFGTLKDGKRIELIS